MTRLMLIIVLALSFAGLVVAEEAPAPAEPAASLKPGDAVTLDAITGSAWVQGTAPAQWEKGKLYMLECWATWCGPCKAVIPHVN